MHVVCEELLSGNLLIAVDVARLPMGPNRTIVEPNAAEKETSTCSGEQEAKTAYANLPSLQKQHIQTSLPHPSSAQNPYWHCPLCRLRQQPQVPTIREALNLLHGIAPSFVIVWKTISLGTIARGFLLILPQQGFQNGVMVIYGNIVMISNGSSMVISMVI